MNEDKLGFLEIVGYVVLYIFIYMYMTGKV